jgi:nucleosome assembly protein 1-like 1
MSSENVIEKCEGTVINWKDGKDVTKKKVKKKSKKKGAKAVTKTVEQESFFNFFKTIEMPDEKKLEGKAEEGEEDQKDPGELMDEDFDVGNEFKDQLIPLALEYYLEVIEEEEENSEGECCSDDDDHHHHGKGGKDSDDDHPKKGKKGGDKKGGAAGAPGQ